jgi:hypothetical protein
MLGGRLHAALRHSPAATVLLAPHILATKHLPDQIITTATRRVTLAEPQPPPTLLAPRSTMEGPELGIPLEPPRHVLWQRAALTVIEEHPYEIIAGGIMAIIFVAALVPHFVRRQLPEKADNIPVDVLSDGDESVYADTREVKQEQPSDEEGSSSSGLYSIPAKRSQSVR